MSIPMQHPAFRALPPVEREVIYRRHKQQLWVDIAEEIDLSEEETKAVYQRAMNKLKLQRGREHASH